MLRLMPNRGPTRRRIVVGTFSAAFVLAGMGVVGAQALSSHQSGPPLIGFQAVSAARLSELGVELTATPENPSMPQAAAERAASAAFASAKVREAHFARCDVANVQPEIHQTCWAISLDPREFHSHGTPGSRVVRATYLVALIDPTSGQMLMAESGA